MSFSKEPINIGIILALPADCSGRPVPGINEGIVRKRHKFFLNFLDELLGGAAGKIRAADRFGEQGVAAEYDAVPYKAYAPW